MTDHHTIPAQPFLKWAGGKGQLLDQYAPLFPADVSGAYYEPFVGSGAVFFHLRGAGLPVQRWHLADVNAALITCYCVVRDDLGALIDHLAVHKAQHSHDYYYAVRNRDRDPAWADVPDVARAARLIYLNKTCYNGLWRVNSKGQFNVPMGRYTKPDILNEDRLRAASAALAGVSLVVESFESVLDRAGAGDFVYFDPPYVPLSATASFTSYAAGDFGPDDQRRLADVFGALAARGCRVMLSNSDTPLVRDLYAGFDLRTVQARRAINSRRNGRGPVDEVVVRNY
ncbi:MAG: DNA adenine methylase [Anaerolineae bacterium]|nr:DNA adenine methylase [Anaerolineae bacterium]